MLKEFTLHLSLAYGGISGSLGAHTLLCLLIVQESLIMHLLDQVKRCQAPIISFYFMQYGESLFNIQNISHKDKHVSVTDIYDSSRVRCSGCKRNISGYLAARCSTVLASCSPSASAGCILPGSIW